MAKKQTAAQKAANAKTRQLFIAAKAKGLVRAKGPTPKNFKPSKYMKSKLRAIEPYLGKEFTAVKVSAKMRKTWEDAPSASVPKVINGRLMVRTPPGAKVKKSNGVLSIVTHLDAGTFEQIPLPVKVENLQEFREWFKSNKYYNNILKHRDERFNFRIFGNDSYNGFGDLEALFQELEKYDNFESNNWETSGDFWVGFELFRSYKDWTAQSHMTARAKHRAKSRREAYDRKLARMKANAPDKYAAMMARKNENRSAARISTRGYQAEKERAKKKRAEETPEQKEARRAKHRAYMAKRRGKE